MLCLQAYNWLRKSANLILNLLSLMSDAGISELSANPVAVLAKVEERFRLDLTDEMVSSTSFQGLLPKNKHNVAEWCQDVASMSRECL